MYINSFLFIFVFLPLALAAYYLSGRYRNIVLSCFDIVFFLLNALEYTFIFVLFLVFNIAAGRLIGRAREGSTARKLLFAAGITADALILVIGKLPETTVIPLGLSFLVFKAISYLSDVYLKRIELDGDQFRDLVYLSFFGQLQSGPIARYKDMEFRGRDMSLICGGAYRFVIGFSKKVLLADVLGKITAEVFSADPASVSMSYAWLGAVCWALELFYDFAGYSDMAIGISNMFGFECHLRVDIEVLAQVAYHARSVVQGLYLHTPRRVTLFPEMACIRQSVHGLAAYRTVARYDAEFHTVGSDLLCSDRL